MLNLDDVEIITKDGQLFKMENFDYEDENGAFPFGAYSTPLGTAQAVAVAQMFSSETDANVDQRSGAIQQQEGVPQG